MAATATRTSQTMRALLRLRELILSGEFGHGDRMSELPLVERLGVSRTPVRLALAKLEHEGLLRALPAGGYVVTEFSRADIVDATELRGVLEGTAARFAAERGPAVASCARSRRRRGDRRSRPPGRLRVLRALRRPQRSLPPTLVHMAGSPQLDRALEGDPRAAFASASAFVMAEAELPASREILVVAHSQHLGLIDASSRATARAPRSLAREHARLAIANLKIALRHRGIRPACRDTR